MAVESEEPFGWHRCYWGKKCWREWQIGGCVEITGAKEINAVVEGVSIALRSFFHNTDLVRIVLSNSSLYTVLTPPRSRMISLRPSIWAFQASILPSICCMNGQSVVKRDMENIQT